MPPALILHGGAGRVFKDPARAFRIRDKIFRITQLAYQRLLRSNALEAAVYAVTMLEDDPDFNAGTGSYLQSDGKARLSASVMDAESGRFAAVANIEAVKNPVLVAKALLKEKDRVLAAEGAVRYARKLGFRKFDTRTKDALARWKKAATEHDTVGACALDSKGRLACATSTGGKGFERVGRMSDSSMPVANFASKHCAVAATGVGEDIIDEGIALKIGARVEDGSSLEAAFERTFRRLRPGRKLGAVGLDPSGRFIWKTTTENLIFGARRGYQMTLFSPVVKGKN